MIALLDCIHACDDASDAGEKLDYRALLANMGVIDADFFGKNAFVEFLPTIGQRWLNLQDPHVIEELRRRLAPWLRHEGCDEFDFSDLVARNRKVTQHIAALAVSADFNGVIYLSRMHPGERCWALFEGTALHPDSLVLPLNPDDQDFETVRRAFGLRLPAELRVVKPLEPQGLPTGGVVHGNDPARASTPVRE